ncbi:DNA-binding response regulator, LuxR family [Geomicrobium sp. JCM 19037]|uniref:response regulator n=1 Tax=Geomicrobium sp. JCM 19037 TaxID=1460634 RepID=UPI00045F2BD7|nr:response regulator transcription factor [Geomicrobium sp. JCM 19037]GAK03481.1 DNA-binding response regulator, LuxR family [Geomicrobium sp. JCM 19037]
MPTTVLLVDDHNVVLKGLRFFLETKADLQVVGMANDGKEAYALAMDVRPDVIVMDVIMPVQNGIVTTEQLKKDLPDTKIIMLTSSAEKEHVIPAIRAGADGYQLKDIDPDYLYETIVHVASGEREHALHPQVASQLMTHVATDDGPNAFALLTAREAETLRQVTLGKSNKEIATALFISEKTVKTHLTNIFSKLHVNDRTQAAILALKNQWFNDIQT